MFEQQSSGGSEVFISEKPDEINVFKLWNWIQKPTLKSDMETFAMETLSLPSIASNHK